MSEQDEIKLYEKVSEGLKKSYEDLIRRKAALGLDVVIGDKDGQPLIVPAADLLTQISTGQK